MSVIIPTYNRAEMLPQAMASVWAQTYRPIELVVVDDGSTDNTGDVVAQLGRRYADDSRFTLRYVYHENRGLPASRNAGFCASRGEYIQFLDSDDYLHPERFQRALAAAGSTPEFQVVVTGYEFVDEDGHTLSYREPMDLTVADPVERCICRPLWAASPVYARQFVEQVGLFQADLTYAEDWAYGVRVAISCTSARCVALNEPLAYYRSHSGPRIVTSKRTRRQIQALFAAGEASVLRAGLGARHLDLLAIGLVCWFVEHNEGAYLRQALALRCSMGMKGRVLAVHLLSKLMNATVIVRLWWRLRRAVAARASSGTGAATE